MIYTISKGDVTVSVNSLGAELYSLKKGETEYLWQGNPAYWNGRAYNLFPIVARLTEGKYTWQGKEYQMGIHGFVRKTEMQVSSQTKASITFTMTDSAETRSSYPFAFRFSVRFTITKKGLKVSYITQNTGSGVLPFSTGGHPGFNVPLSQGEAFEDYKIVFPQGATPMLVEMSEDCFVMNGKTPLALNENNALALRHNLFDHDALVLQNAGKTVTLIGKQGRGVTVEYAGLKYLGIWHKPQTDAPYVCLEPWASLPTRKGTTDDFSTKPDFTHLAPGKTKTFAYTIIPF
ncbi:MAG: aldose 1-epimerase family protein [Clostridia bacterium]|nr:aldose 1-epimerase family protein [Clostridia bacterium]